VLRSELVVALQVHIPVGGVIGFEFVADLRADAKDAGFEVPSVAPAPLSPVNCRKVSDQADMGMLVEELRGRCGHRCHSEMLTGFPSASLTLDRLKAWLHAKPPKVDVQLSGVSSWLAG
jgi:hypothetical protein